ncbi:MAG: hypothetical protein WDZ52_05700 [Pseudohongiellaceae bacterium]
MKNLIAFLVLASTLVACESLYDDGGIPRIRSQKQVDDYNATVSSESEKLVCTRERPTGSNIRQFICMTVAQRDRMALESQQTLQGITGAQNRISN